MHNKSYIKGGHVQKTLGAILSWIGSKFGTQLLLYRACKTLNGVPQDLVKSNLGMHFTTLIVINYHLMQDQALQSKGAN